MEMYEAIPQIAKGRFFERDTEEGVIEKIAREIILPENIVHPFTLNTISDLLKATNN
jgi:hypothetical protein